MRFIRYKYTSNEVGVFISRFALPRRWAVIGLTVQDAQLSALGQDVRMRDPNNRAPTRVAFRPKHSGALCFLVTSFFGQAKKKLLAVQRRNQFKNKLES
jgi:superfamily I DNA and RNA helicase